MSIPKRTFSISVDQSSNINNHTIRRRKTESDEEIKIGIPTNSFKSMTPLSTHIQRKRFYTEFTIG